MWSSIPGKARPLSKAPQQASRDRPISGKLGFKEGGLKRQKLNSLFQKEGLHNSWYKRKKNCFSTVIHAKLLWWSPIIEIEPGMSIIGLL